MFEKLKFWKKRQPEKTAIVNHKIFSGRHEVAGKHYLVSYIINNGVQYFSFDKNPLYFHSSFEEALKEAEQKHFDVQVQHG
jgi:hypothetical protein